MMCQLLLQPVAADAGTGAATTPANSTPTATMAFSTRFMTSPFDTVQPFSRRRDGLGGTFDRLGATDRVAASRIVRQRGIGSSNGHRGQLLGSVFRASSVRHPR